MAIHQINYVEGNSFVYKPDANKAGLTYQHSLGVTIGHYAQDQYGRAIDPPTDNVPAKFTNVRSFYTASSDEPGMLNFPLTFEGVVQLLSTRRARTVEAEISPMAITIQNRNQTLKELGVVLGGVSAGMANLEENDKNGNAYVANSIHILNTYFTPEELKKAGIDRADDDYWNMEELKLLNALFKSEIDKLNNEAQTDMSRMESLVSKRDESFTLASDLTSTVSDGRTSIINNMGG